MFSPRGVPLTDLEDALAPTTLKASRKDDALIVQHEKLTTRVEVIEPANRESENGPISAVVTIKTPLPREFTSFLNKPDMVSLLNAMASLSAVQRGRAALHRVAANPLRGGGCLEDPVSSPAVHGYCWG